MKYSIVIPTYNGVQLLTESLAKVFSCTEDFEVIVVDNSSTDGTKGYIKDLTEQYSNLKYISFPENCGFSKACNAGMSLAKGDFIILLNNDVLVTPNWASQMASSIRRFEKSSKLRIGLVGPATNFAGGRQNVPDVKYDLNALDEFATQFHKRNITQLDEAGFLSGFCLMIKRSVIDEIGFLDEEFFPGGYEDNDFILRAAEVGWYSMIDGSTFVHHKGSQTLKREEFKSAEGGLASRNLFLDKWKKKTQGPKKLVGIYRVKGPDDHFKASLQGSSKFCDEIVVLIDNPGPEDKSKEIAERFFPKVSRIETFTGEFNEKHARNLLVQMAYEANADWIISIDDDEVFEDKFDRAYVERLMHPPNPAVKMYGFQWRTFFNGDTHFRADGIFGNMAGFRMFKAEPNRKITRGTHNGLHCGNIPMHSIETARWTGIRIKHYGYDTKEKCSRKYNFYENIDVEKNASLIGGANYIHLIQNKMVMYPWVENSSLSLVTVVHNGGHKLWELLDLVGYSVDEIIFGDNQSNDDSVETAKRFGAKIIPVQFKDDFSKLKNQVLKKATRDWILLMDWDEEFKARDIPFIRRMMDNDCDGYMFPVYNYQSSGQVSLSEAVRLFRNKPVMRYTGRVHENFDEITHKKLVTITRTQMILHHYGFLAESKELDRKLVLYERLNKLQLEENPEDPRAAFNLALHYMNANNRIEAERLLKYAITLNPRFYQAHKELGLSYIRQGQDCILEAKQLLPQDHPMYQMLEALLNSITNVIGSQDIVIGSGR